MKWLYIYNIHIDAPTGWLCIMYRFCISINILFIFILCFSRFLPRLAVYGNWCGNRAHGNQILSAQRKLSSEASFLNTQTRWKIHRGPMLWASCYRKINQFNCNFAIDRHLYDLLYKRFNMLFSVHSVYTLIRNTYSHYHSDRYSVFIVPHP